MANFSRTSRAAQGKKFKFFNDLCDTFGFGIPIFTYFEKKPYSTPFQIGVTVEELGISGNTGFQFNWFSQFNKLFCIKNLKRTKEIEKNNAKRGLTVDVNVLNVDPSND
jgi:hypothetical protein